MWVNVYRDANDADGWRNMCSLTREDADMRVGTRTDRIACVPVTFAEGEGLADALHRKWEAEDAAGPRGLPETNGCGCVGHCKIMSGETDLLRCPLYDQLPKPTTRAQQIDRETDTYVAGANAIHAALMPSPLKAAELAEKIENEVFAAAENPFSDHAALIAEARRLVGDDMEPAVRSWAPHNTIPLIRRLCDALEGK